MESRFEFAERAGMSRIPLPDPFPPEGPRIPPDFREFERLFELKEFELFRFCSVALREGCYRLFIRPRFGAWISLTQFKGTLRVERNDDDLTISADLYKYTFYWNSVLKALPKKVTANWAAVPLAERARGTRAIPAKLLDWQVFKKNIPIYPRNKYCSYLLGTSASLTNLVQAGGPCQFSLFFDEYYYQQPTTGFDGSFPATSDRSVEMRMQTTGTADNYTGKLYSGSLLLGDVSLCWVSSSFRRAQLEVHTLEGAVAPQPVPHPSGTGNEDFSTIFATAGWNLSVSYNGTDIALPATLTDDQDPDACWSKENSHDLMDSVPSYDPTELDKKWKAHLVAVPAALGCSRGRMFDNGTGDVNDIAREGAVTHSDDGYPVGDSANFGDAEGEMQRQHPRAFLRSAAHEVGHTFNQVHQSNFGEGGIDNSIMTVTPSVANVLAAAGDEFPDDIDLAFNETVRHHLIHAPDPAVRPGAMSFAGNTVPGPEADINFFDATDLELALRPSQPRVKLGQPLAMAWHVANRTGDSIPVPERLDCEHLVARISVTDPSGSITYLKPYNMEHCARIAITDLAPGKDRGDRTNLFWSPNGFAFKVPGKHRVDVMVFWPIDGGAARPR